VSALAQRTGFDLARLESLSPTDRWDLEDAIDEAQGTLREFNDEELCRWVEGEHKTQAEIAEMVGRTQSTVSYRCSRLGIVSGSKRGRPRNIEVDNSADAEVVDGEIVDEPKPRRRQSPDGPAHHFPDVVAADAEENLRTQALHWFEQGAHIKGLLDGKRPLEPRSAEDRKAIKREAALMERVARRLKEAANA